MSYLRLLSFERYLQSMKTLQLNSKLFKTKINCFSSLSKPNTVKDIKRAAIKNLDPSHSRFKKDVLIYQNENTSFYRRLFLINVSQFIFFVYVANFGLAFYMGRPKKLTEEEINEKLMARGDKGYFARAKIVISENWRQVSLSLVFLTVGHISMALISMFMIRSIRYIILHSSGNKVRISCFSFFGSPNRYRNHDIPLENISAAQHRNSPGSYIPIKVKGRIFYFLVDKKGHFFHPTLFDETVGVFRILK